MKESHDLTQVHLYTLTGGQGHFHMAENRITFIAVLQIGNTQCQGHGYQVKVDGSHDKDLPWVK